MRDIRRPDNLEAVVDRLTSQKYTETETPVFQTIMDLLIFAAGVGVQQKRRTAVPSTGRGIPVRIFEGNQKDGYLYLVALATKQDPSALEAVNDDETAKIFEEYAAGGLEQIAEWLSKDGGDFSGVGTLLAQMQSFIPLEPQTTEYPNPI